MKHKIIDLFDQHHITPISLWWDHLKHNIEQIRRPLHDFVHDTLNIPMRLYSHKTRQIKKKTNHKLVSTLDGTKLVYEMQKEYFKRVYELPSETVNIHERKMLETVGYWENQADQLMGYSNQLQGIENFHDMHKYLFEVKEKIACELQKELKKKYYM